MTERCDYDMHCVSRISNDSNETKKKYLFRASAIISDESNEVGLSAQNWLFCSNASTEATFLN